MPRKIPNRSGTAVSNEDRLVRSHQFTMSASKYEGLDPSAAGAATSGAKAEQSRDKEVSPEEEKGAWTENVGSKPNEAAKKLSENCSHVAEARSRTYYVRILEEDRARLNALAAQSGLTSDYIQRALMKSVRACIHTLRDTATWHEVATAAQPCLVEPKGTGTPFMKSIIRLDSVQEDILRASIGDPLRVYGVTQLLSAVGKTLLRSEIDRLGPRLSGIESPAADPDPT